MLSLYTLSFGLISIYYALSLFGLNLDQGAADLVTIFRYLVCECLPLGFVMIFQFKNHKILINQWKCEQNAAQYASPDKAPESEEPVSEARVSSAGHTASKSKIYEGDVSKATIT